MTDRDQSRIDLVARLKCWCHAPRAQAAQDIMDEAADEIERLRELNLLLHTAEQFLKAAAEDRWIDRNDREPPDTNKQYLLYTTAMEGFVWFGRRGLLPQSVTHWMEIPEPPAPSMRQDEPASGQV